MDNAVNHPASSNFELPDEVLKCLADYGKLLLGPFLKALMEDYEEGDLGPQPSPKWIGVSIYENYYQNGELDFDTQEVVLKEAKSFLHGMIPYQRTAVAAYLYQQRAYREFLEEELETEWSTDDSEWTTSHESYERKELEFQIRIHKAITTCDINDMAHWLTKEAQVVEDIMGDTESWDASSAANTNEYFEHYLGFSADYFKVFKVNHSDYSFFSYLMNEECELREFFNYLLESMPEDKENLEILQNYMEEHMGIKRPHA